MILGSVKESPVSTLDIQEWFAWSAVNVETTTIFGSNHVVLYWCIGKVLFNGTEKKKYHELRNVNNEFDLDSIDCNSNVHLCDSSVESEDIADTSLETIFSPDSNLKENKIK